MPEVGVMSKVRLGAKELAADAALSVTRLVARTRVKVLGPAEEILISEAARTAGRGSLPTGKVVDLGPPGEARRGGLQKLVHGARVQGSDVIGGSQPTFRVDLEDEAIQELVAHARQAREKNGGDTWATVYEIQAWVRKHLKFGGYHQPDYVAFNRANLGKEVRIGDYLRLGWGVCRENALLTQIGLQGAGLDSRLIYVRVYGPEGRYYEDHALNLLPKGDDWQIVDTRIPWLNGVSWSAMQSEGAFGNRFLPHPELPFTYSTAPSPDMAVVKPSPPPRLPPMPAERLQIPLPAMLGRPAQQVQEPPPH